MKFTKSIAVLGFVLLFAVTGVAADSGRYLTLTDENFAQQTANKLVIVDFWASWCGPCMNFAPTFETVSAQVTGVTFGKVNVDTARATSTKYNVTGIPYIVALKNGVVVAEFNGSRTVANFKTWCQNQIASQGGSTTSAAATHGSYLNLTEANFTQNTAGKLVIVDFWASWCGPCMNFAPTFEAVSAQVPGLAFGKVNVDEARTLSARYAVRSIPYIVALQNGVVVATYNGSRTAENFKAWCVTQKSGTGASASSTASSVAAGIAVGAKYTFAGGYFSKVSSGKWSFCLNGTCTDLAEKTGTLKDYTYLWGFFKPQNKNRWVIVPKKNGNSYWYNDQTKKWVLYKSVVKQ